VTKPAVVRFYFDADVLGLAKCLGRLRSDMTYPGDLGGVIHRRVRPACPITTPATEDSTWIPVVSDAGWLIVTRDSRIQHRRAEINAVRDSSARMLALASRDAAGVWSQLEVFMSQWRRIEALTVRPGPFICTVSRTALNEVDLS
jgi:hypothetical protein